TYKLVTPLPNPSLESLSDDVAYPTWHFLLACWFFAGVDYFRPTNPKPEPTNPELTSSSRHSTETLETLNPISNLNRMGAPFSSCGKRARIFTSWTDTNPSHRFWGCANYGVRLLWLD
ncbi:unnamed protein product, partial [Prunus brigantina]